MTSTALRLFGTDSALPQSRHLRAGPLSAVLEEGQLRRICWQGQEAIRAISFLVRNTSWGTYAAEIFDLQVAASNESFEIRYFARCADAEQTLRYAVMIVGHAQGQLSFEAKLEPLTNFSTNRAGFVVLHPLDGVAGEPVTVTHTDGRVVQAQFPKHVVGSQPVLDIRALDHQVRPGVRCLCTMEGDAFEMEDQRNWTDASFKTYVRPLSKPFPYTLPAQQVSHQAVRLQFLQTQASPALVNERAEGHVITLESGSSGDLPQLGIAIDDEAPWDHSHQQALTTLRPQWLVARVHAKTSMVYLANVAQAAGATSAKVCLEVVVSCERPIEEELAEIATLAARVQLTAAAVAVAPGALLRTVPSDFQIPGLPSQNALFEATRKAFPSALVGGGSLAYFTELNRNRPDATALDFITHTTCPIVHASDDHSVMESLQALPWIFESTLQFAGKAAYWLGPTSMGMRFNPYGAAPADNPQNARVAMAKADPRQRGVFGAAFYTAYAAIASRAGLANITFAALTGPHGLVYSRGPEPKPGFDERGAGVYPAFHALCWLAQAAGRPRVALNMNPGGAVDGLAFVNATGGKTLLLANTTAQAQPVTLSGAATLKLRALDETSFEAATQTLTWSDDDGTSTVHTFSLRPYAVARVQLS